MVKYRVKIIKKDLHAKSLHSRVLVDITLLQATNMLFCVTNYYLNINVF